MKRILEKLFGKSAPEPTLRTWKEWDDIRQQTTRSWQLQWHDLFDKDKVLQGGEWDRPAEIPDDIDHDTRLHFGLTCASAETREACFALFPNGAEMAQRLDSFLTAPRQTVPEQEARAIFARLIKAFQAIGPIEDFDFTNIEIADRTTEEGRNMLFQTDGIMILEEQLSFFPGNKEEKVDEVAFLKSVASSFLREPLYFTAGNYYHLGDWVISAMYGGTEESYEYLVHHLWISGWTAHLGNEGVILAHH